MDVVAETELKIYIGGLQSFQKFLGRFLGRFFSATQLQLSRFMYGRDPPNMIHLERTAEYDPSSYHLFLRKKLAEFRDFVECQMVESQKRQKYYFEVEI